MYRSRNYLTAGGCDESNLDSSHVPYPCVVLCGRKRAIKAMWITRLIYGRRRARCFIIWRDDVLCRLHAGHYEYEPLYQQVLKLDAQFCLPEWGISNSYAARIVVKHLRDYPEEIHRNEFVLALLAVNVAFPCKKGP